MPAKPDADTRPTSRKTEPRAAARKAAAARSPVAEKTGPKPAKAPAKGGAAAAPAGLRTARKAPPRKAGATGGAAGRAAHARAEALAPHRFLIEAVAPEIEGGRFPVKREVGDPVEVTADIVTDGHNQIAARLLWRAEEEADWRIAPMAFIDNDRWGGSFAVDRNTRYRYTIEAWVDDFETWRRDLLKKANAGQHVEIDLLEGRNLVDRAAKAAKGDAGRRLKAAIEAFDKTPDSAVAERMDRLLDPDLEHLMQQHAPKTGLTRYPRELELIGDRVAARHAAWYEMFWRSQGTDPSRSATVDECIDRLPYVRDLGFDVVYLVPHHPIGKTNRKGKNNALVAGPKDPGSPYAIGSEEGGHDAMNPEWGTLEDFRRFVAATHEHGMEVAIDFAIQCSPDHPWIRQHPEWFDWRPDGSIKYAENPPKKYEDIVNVDFYTADGEPKLDLWEELRDIVLFWIDQGVRIFRVDNPHTKPLPFWQWMIREVQTDHPDAIFLAEAFTRPKLMKALAKIGFTQSYSYFTWRTEKQEIVDYLEELTQGPAADYMRANFFPNTPDILPKILQEGGRPAFLQRIVLAATLSSVYGMYNGYELCENSAVPGKEEYLNSEKYQYKVWDWDRPGNIKDWIRRLNEIRRDNPALHEYTNLRFYPAHDPNILVYGKMTVDRSNAVLVAVNLDPYAPHEANFELPLWELGLPDWETLEMEELFSGHRFTWTGKHQHIWIDNDRPAFIWRMRPAAGTPLP